MAKLINLIPKGNVSIKESLDDMDVTLPSQVEKFLDRLVNQIKGYNLPKKKEQLVIAKVIDALGMDKQQLMQAIQKIKKNDIIKEATMHNMTRETSLDRLKEVRHNVAPYSREAVKHIDTAIKIIEKFDVR